MWGCSSVVERMLCMYEAPGSIPGISIAMFCFYREENNPCWIEIRREKGMEKMLPSVLQ